jgi:hypothetical protein
MRPTMATKAEKRSTKTENGSRRLLWCSIRTETTPQGTNIARHIQERHQEGIILDALVLHLLRQLLCASSFSTS